MWRVSERENSNNSNITRFKDPTEFWEITSEETDDDEIKKFQLQFEGRYDLYIPRPSIY